MRIRVNLIDVVRKSKKIQHENYIQTQGKILNGRTKENAEKLEENKKKEKSQQILTVFHMGYFFDILAGGDLLHLQTCTCCVVQLQTADLSGCPHLILPLWSC